MAKKALLWLTIAFAVFYLITAPGEAAAAVRSAGGGLRDAGDSVATFLQSLFGGAR